MPSERHEVVIDTTVFKRAIDETLRNRRFKSKAPNFIERGARKRQLAIVLDDAKSLRDEYLNTCSPEPTKVFLVLLADLGALHYRCPVVIPEPARTRLRVIGFDGARDKLVLKIALAGPHNGKTLCSDDKHFWDGRTTQSVGNHTAEVCTIIESTGAVVCSHAELLLRIPSA
jgi:hypothetical protein